MTELSRSRLSPEAVDSLLGDLPAWSLEEGKLHREYKFPDFSLAIGFMMAAATFIAEIDHHPEWFNVYGTVRIDIWTHDSGGVTALDFQ
ncbi:MAG: 4a-hydroxytetrahydrobiopterin dehydratase, partial [Bryobacteraceae bacterium]|nr:4a-hydroxytetrahydrobiopterin dehydratase [Bryobacteraceae bacterium]